MIKAFLIFTFFFSSFFEFHLQAGKSISFPKTKKTVKRATDLPKKVIKKVKQRVIRRIGPKRSQIDKPPYLSKYDKAIKNCLGTIPKTYLNDKTQIIRGEGPRYLPSLDGSLASLKEKIIFNKCDAENPPEQNLELEKIYNAFDKKIKSEKMGTSQKVCIAGCLARHLLKYSSTFGINGLPGVKWKTLYEKNANKVAEVGAGSCKEFTTVLLTLLERIFGKNSNDFSRTKGIFPLVPHDAVMVKIDGQPYDFDVLTLFGVIPADYQFLGKEKGYLCQFYKNKRRPYTSPNPAS